MPNPAQLAERIGTLQQLHPWMDSATTAVLAQQQNSTQQMLGVADNLRAQAASTYNGYTPYSYDSALHTPSSTRAFAQQYVNTVAGGNPLSTNSLATIQQGLQRQGYGRDLVATGAWDRNWQQALTDHAQAVYHDQLSGNRPLSTSSHGFLHSVLHSISPSGIASAVVGTIKSLPSDFRSLTADVLGGAAEIGGIATYGLEQAATGHGAEGIRASQRLGARIGAKVESALGNDMSAQDYYARTQDWGRAINDLGTIAIITPGLGEAVGSGARGLRTLGTGADFATAQGGQGIIRSSLGRTVGHEAAIRSPRLLAQGVATKAGQRIVQGAAIGGTAGGISAGVQGQDISTGITSGAATGAALGALARVGERAGARAGLPANALDNIPVLRQTGPLIGRLATEDGLYYRMRNVLAKPYEYGSVRLAGDALTKGQVASLKVSGLSWLENTLGDDPNSQPLARYIAGSHPLDPIDHALAAAAEKAHLPFSPKVDWLLYALHGDLGGTGKEFEASQGATGDIARKVQNLHDGLDNALGQTGFAERIARGTNLSPDELLAHAGGDELLLKEWMLDKVLHAAASLHADNALRKLPTDTKRLVTSDHDSYVQFMRNARDEAWRDNATLHANLDLMAKAEHTNYLELAIQRELTRPDTSFGESLRHDIGTYARAGRVVRDQILPRIEADFLTPTEKTFGLGGVAPEMRALVEQAGFGTTVAVPAKGPVAAGSIGLLRKGKLTSQQAERDLQGFSARANDLLERFDKVRGRSSYTMEQAAQRGQQTAEQAKDELRAVTGDLEGLKDELLGYAHDNYGLDSRSLRVYRSGDHASDVDKLLSLLADAKKNLASEVLLAPDASPEATAALDRLDRLGYTLVHGTDIGHSFRADLPKNIDLGQYATRSRQVVNALGLGLERFSHTDISTRMRATIVGDLTRGAESGRFSLGQYRTARTILNDLADESLVGDKLSWAQNLAFATARRAHRGTIERLAGELRTPDMSPGDAFHAAEARLKGELAMAGGLRALDRKTVVRVLTREDPDGVPFTDASSANRIYDTIMAAQSKSLTRQVGLTKVEDMLRFMPFRALANERWNLDRLRTLASLPNDLVRARDQWRFAMNPWFSARRVFKTNMKMMTDGVTPTITPVKSLEGHGAWDEAHTLLDDVLGHQKGYYTYLDESERYLEQTDLYGVYSPRQYEAWYVWNKKQQGYSTDEIRKGLVRVFQYGGRGQEGRTALERSTNVVFFPFSFEKTVIRNIGGHLLDHQAQALVLSNALDAYRQFSAAHPNSPLTSAWLDKHAPVLNEALRLNAFAHGISPGELGGINRPILNAFLPQSWATSKDTTKTLERFVPAVADLHRLMGEIGNQQQVVRTSLHNATMRLEGKGGNSLYRLPSNETSSAQIGDALRFRVQLIDAFSDVLDYNDSQSDDNAKYHFGYADNIPADIQGMAINRETLSKIVQHAYPAWNPDMGIEIAKSRREAAQTWVNTQHDSPDFERYRDYLAKAQTAIGHMNRDDYPLSQLTTVQQLFRDEADSLVKNNPAFRGVYERTFARYFGPLGVKV